MWCVINICGSSDARAAVATDCSLIGPHMNPQYFLQVRGGTGVQRQNHRFLQRLSVSFREINSRLTPGDSDQIGYNLVGIRQDQGTLLS